MTLTPLTPDRRLAARAGWFVVLAGASMLAAWVFATRVSHKMPDFDVYQRAATRAAAGESLYRAEDGHYQFKYLPAFALLLLPLAAADAAVARPVWFAGSLGFLVLLLYASLRLLDAARAEPPRGRRKPPWLLVSITIAVLGKFYARELVLGQVNLPFAVVVVAALLAMRRGRETTAGALVALAVVLKPYGVLLLPWLAARREPQAILAAAAGLAIALVAPTAMYGFEADLALHRAWWETVTTTTAPNLLNPDNVSWLSMYARWFGGLSGPWPPTLLVLTIVCAFGITAWVWSGREELRFPEGLEGALLLAMMPLLSPQGWDYVLLVATPAVMLVVAYAHRLPAWLQWLTIGTLATIGLTIYDLMGRAAYLGFMNASGITLCFFVVIAALAVLRARRVA